MYFPGDAAAMLADVAGAGLPSIVVPADGTVFSLTAAATIGTGSGVTAGANIALATCRASMSTGGAGGTCGTRPLPRKGARRCAQCLLCLSFRLLAE